MRLRPESNAPAAVLFTVERFMRFAILGWGSLIWDPRDLPVTGEWFADGPTLPIEFSRVSSDKRLTLVIDEQNGTQVPTQYIQSPRNELSRVISDLQSREGMPSARHIGFVDRSAEKRSARINSIAKTIEDWASARNIEAVVWTDLPPNFAERCGTLFSVEAAAQHLQSLSPTESEKALCYIRRAPAEVETALRTYLRAGGQL